MDEQKREERNAHTVESEPGVGRLVSGRRLWLRSWGHWPMKEATPLPLSTKKCCSFNCLCTLATTEDRRSLWVCFTRGWEECGGGAECHTWKL